MQPASPSETPATPEDTLTPAAAAQLLGIPLPTLATWRFRRVGPPFLQLSARTPRYSRAALVAWLSSRAVTP